MLRLHNISTGYGQLPVLQGVSLHIESGEIVAVLGSNGAGKSTLIRAICGLLKYRGQMTLQGQPLDGLSADRRIRSGIGVVPEGRGIFGNLTVAEHLQLGATIAGQASRADYVYSQFPRLFERRKQYAGTLSGGEQQMLAIGRVLMSDARLLLLDELSMGLAPVIVESLFTILQDLNRDGRTILLIEQNAAMALSVASRGYVMEKGCLTLQGTAGELAQSACVKQIYLGA